MNKNNRIINRLNTIQLRTAFLLACIALSSLRGVFAGNISLSIDGDFEVGTTGYHYALIPQTGSNTLTLSGAASFMVYDPGGKNDWIKDGGDGSLLLAAPSGYVIQIAGLVNAYSRTFTAHDGSTVSSNKLINVVNGHDVSVATTSTGNSMLLRFYGENYDHRVQELELTVNIYKKNTSFALTVNNPSTGGTIKLNKTSAKPGELVTATITPSTGYLLTSYGVKDAYGNELQMQGLGSFGNTATFKMPTSTVTVTPTFSTTWTAEEGVFANMIAGQRKTIQIPEGVTTFKVYDDGGKDYTYAGVTDSYLVIKAPAGYIVGLKGSFIEAETSEIITFYNGTVENEGALLKKVYGQGRSGNYTFIFDGRSNEMLIHFHSGSETPHYKGFGLTVELADASVEHNITVNTSIYGTVTPNKSTAKIGELVRVTATPKDGYMVNGIQVKKGSGAVVSTTNSCNWYDDCNATYFYMPNSDVKVTPVFVSKTEYNTLSIYMPARGTTNAYIPEGVSAFPIYGNSGLSSAYSSNCDGYLCLTAPEGYVFQLAGSLKTDNVDFLTIYDGDTTDANVMLNEFRSSNIGVGKSFGDIMTSGNKMLLHFYSDDYLQYTYGFQIAVKVLKSRELTWYTISKNYANGGTFSLYSSGAHESQVVQLMGRPYTGYMINGFMVEDASGNEIPVSECKWYSGTNTATFIMPAKNVYVTPIFIKATTAEGGLYINLPTEGTLLATIPKIVKSFKVYDDGGKTGNHSSYCTGKLALTAASGYKMEVSGTVTTRAKTDEDDDPPTLTIYDDFSKYNGYYFGGNEIISASSTTNGVAKNLGYHASSGNKMMIEFASYNDTPYAGIDIKVDMAYHGITTDISEAMPQDDNGEMTNDKARENEGWYTLDGRKLNGLPMRKGVYVRNGKKIIR